MRERIEELVKILNEASSEYYQHDREIMSNKDYDKLYDELVELEQKSGIVMANSPTVNVGYEVMSSLPKETHPAPMLSLDKTKEVEQLKSWLGDKEGLLSWKLDGLTVVLTYEDGKLSKAVTRGNGTIGEVITPNARVFENIPVQIPETGQVVVRGEAVISYQDFENINQDGTYKNPRNLCSGSVRQLNSEITAGRHVRFYAFSLASAGNNKMAYRHEQIEWMKNQGFATVENIPVNSGNIAAAVDEFSRRIENFEIPSDGLVLIFDDIAYGESLGTTAKFPRDSIAFKWRDEIQETTLVDVLWSPSRTGLINPIAVFRPVELEGTTVTRASVHNVSILEDLKLGVGDRITVYKANMIIPQIAENLTGSSNVRPPEHCPVCGSTTIIREDNKVKTLYCPNEACAAKRVKAFTLFVSRDAMNIEGLSEATLEKLIDEAIIKEFADIFKLDAHREHIMELEGFGQKSFENLVNAANKASDTTPSRLLYALGIPNIGIANAKVIAKACHNKWDTIVNLTEKELVNIDGIGEVMARAYVSYFNNESNRQTVEELLKVLSLDESYHESGSTFEGKTFVITGSLVHFSNRNAAKALVEELGGKVAGSVSSKTDYLINNDEASNSSKNKKAKELGIPIITEDEFIALAGKEI